MRSGWGLGAGAAVVLALSACGTRVPDGAFPATATEVGGTTGGTSTGTSGTGGAGTTGGTSTTGTGGTTTGGTVTSGTTGAGGTTTGGPTTGEPNTASDVGVTPTTITLGTISSRSNAFDPTAFVGPLYGVQAWVDEVNRHGGIHGRTVRLVSCDDHGDGSRNNACVHQLIDNQKVFALVSNAIFTYAAAPYVQSKGVPDVGSQPIDTAYDQFSHLWDLYGEAYPRNGTVGYNGQLEGGTENYHYFKLKFPKVPLKAGVVYYNQADSQRFGQYIVKGLRAEGYTVIAKEVNFALPDYDSAVLDMKAQGVEYVFDALDAGGNENLCASMDANGLSQSLTAKVTTTQGWVASIATQYQDAPVCRNKIWAMGNTLNYEDTRFAPVKRFRDAMHRLRTDSPEQMSEWALEGWAGATWLGDAMTSCGAKLTRHCVEAYLSRPVPYTAGGLLTERDFVKEPPSKTEYDCINVARWTDDGHRWVTQVADMQKNCWDVPNVYYTP
jgi:branched-chain amino acid transport system substrate-binding protein